VATGLHGRVPPYATSHCSWMAIASVVVPAGAPIQIQGVTGPSQIASLLPDSGSGAPAAAVLGQPIRGGSAVSITHSVTASGTVAPPVRSEEHTSELQSPDHLV